MLDLERRTSFMLGAVLGIGLAAPACGSTVSLQESGTTTSSASGGAGGTTTSSASGGAGGGATTSSASGGAGGGTTTSSASGGAGGGTTCGVPTPLWSKAMYTAYPPGFSFNTAGQAASFIADDRAGGAFVAGDIMFGEWAANYSYLVPEIHGFLARYDGAGELLWTKRFGPDGWKKLSPTARGVASDHAGNVIFAAFSSAVDLGGGTIGSPSPSTLVAAFDPAGNHLWSSGYDIGMVAALALTSAGDILIASTNDLPYGAQGGVDAVMKLDAAGHPLWSHVYDPSIAIDTVATDGEGNVIFAGTYHEAVDLGGGPLPAPTSMLASFVVKLGPDGNHLWSSAHDAVHVHRLAVDSTGAVLLAGSSLGAEFPPVEAETHVTKLDAAGQLLWSRSFGDGLGHNWPNGLAVGPANDVIVVGLMDSKMDVGACQLVGPTAGSGTHAFVIRLDSAGDPLAAWRYDGDGGAPQGIFAGSAAQVFLAGSFESPTDFGAGVLPQPGYQSAFLVALPP